jgi:NTP pyrophosphatase (non-canonical NTP hydrolase)
MVEKIAHWSNTFGLPIKKEEGFPAKERLVLALALIEEEYKETYQAAAENDFKEVKDGLGDLLWVTIRAMMECGIDPQKTIEAIYESNMSKADTTAEDAVITHDTYKAKGITTYSRVVNGLFITYNADTNKVLKSHKFKQPEL